MEREIIDYILYFKNEGVIIIENDSHESQKDKYQQYQKSLSYEAKE